jgi:hypothetical protein
MVEAFQFLCSLRLRESRSSLFVDIIRIYDEPPGLGYGGVGLRQAEWTRCTLAFTLLCTMVHALARCASSGSEYSLILSSQFCLDLCYILGTFTLVLKCADRCFDSQVAVITKYEGLEARATVAFAGIPGQGDTYTLSPADEDGKSRAFLVNCLDIVAREDKL